MSDDDVIGGCIGTILAYLIVIALIVFVIIYVIVPFLIAVASIGGIWGGFVAVGNYGKSFKTNVIDRKDIKR
jgi:hypothetical protein